MANVHMKLAIFTPTYRPVGLDVLEASLMRQTFRDFVWIVSDQRVVQRKYTWPHMIRSVDFPHNFMSREIK